MGKNHIDRLSEKRTDPDELCWREMLAAALQGFCPPDHHLENMLDHVERTR